MAEFFWKKIKMKIKIQERGTLCMALHREPAVRDNEDLLASEEAARGSFNSYLDTVAL